MTATAPDPQQIALPFEDGLEDAFMRFHMANPAVYQELVKLAREWKRAGHARCSINMLFEKVRYDYGVSVQKTDGWKLNNNHRSRYARLIMRLEPELAGYFETRELHQ